MKTAASQLLLASLALGSAVPRGDKKQYGISRDDFIKVDGLRLYDSKGALHYLTGSSLPYIAYQEY
jgi:mannan endo-1,4-beta-mannosidase